MARSMARMWDWPPGIIGRTVTPITSSKSPGQVPGISTSPDTASGLIFLNSALIFKPFLLE